MICDNLTRIQQRIQEAAGKAGRNLEDIKLVAVSKRMHVSLVQEVVDCGQMLFGENYLQEAAEKIVQLSPALAWHFIGHVQSNKTKQLVELFDVIETVDRWKVAQALDNHAKRQGKKLSILVQVNVGREQQKSGIVPEAVEALLVQIKQATNLRVLGLMTMPPYAADSEQSRPYFRELRVLAQRLAAHNLFADNAKVELSMGMSGDYPVAIEEGATLVRVGTALFGAR